MKVPILMYHSIAKVPRSEVMRSLHVDPSRFKAQMRLLKAIGYRGCSVREALDAFKNSRDEKLVAITFDDGYENFFSAALPILEDFGFCATIYPVLGLLGMANEWDTNTGISRNPLMSASQVREASEKGFEIGCHTLTHRSLIEPNTNFSVELDATKAKLEQLIQDSCESFCYPYGHYNEEVIGKVRNAGFSNAVTMMRGRMTAREDPFLLPRVPVTWHTLPHLFFLKIVSGYEDRRKVK